jgi:hypothetical protein
MAAAGDSPPGAPFSAPQGTGYYGQPVSQYTQSSVYPRQPSGSTAKKSSRGSGLTLILIAVMVAAIAAVPAWHFLKRSPNPTTPTGTMEAYVTAINDDDCETIYKLTPKDLVADVSDEAVNACSQFMGYMDLNLSDFEAMDENIDGDTATVDFQVTLEFAGQTSTEQATAALIKEDGIWKVDSGLS